MRSFLGFGQVPYIGQPGAQAVKLAGISTQVIPLLFQWLAYGASTARPSINVLVDARTKPCDPLGQIRSVYIDNLGSPNPVYVYFPDTNYTVVAKANSEGWYPAFTNDRVLWVIGQGFLTGSIPQTFILLSNVIIQPSVNVELDQAVALWRASPTISRGTSIYNTALGIPALGDQTISYAQPIVTGPIINNMWGSPKASGFFYLTHASLSLTGFLADTGPAGGNLSLRIESTGISGNLYAFDLNLLPSATGTIVSLMELSSMNVKLDATETWRTNIFVAGGFTRFPLFQQVWNFTYQP